MKNLSYILLGFFVSCGSMSLLGSLVLATNLEEVLFGYEAVRGGGGAVPFITLVVIFGAVAIAAFLGLLTLSIIEFVKSREKTKN